jgi:hypothetical protein
VALCGLIDLLQEKDVLPFWAAIVAFTVTLVVWWKWVHRILRKGEGTVVPATEDGGGPDLTGVR